jgi:hypothetical protein
MVFARNARGVQGLRASRRARLDCPARESRMPMQVPAGAEGASAAEGRAAKAALPVAAAAEGRSTAASEQTRVTRRGQLESMA